MRYTTKNKRTLAILLAAVMATSMLAMGFIGGAAADVQEVDDFTADDVVAGADSVEQTVTLTEVENDENDENITITADPDISEVIQSVTLESSGEHDIDSDDVDYDSDSDEITIELGADSGATDDIEITVTHDLSEVQDLTVEYTAAFEDGSSTYDTGERTTSFDISVAQPFFEDTNTTVAPNADNSIDVEFDEDVQVSGDASDLDSAFDLTDVEDDSDPATALEIVDYEVDGSTLTLVLSDFVFSDVSDVEVDYNVDSNEGEETSSSDVVVHAADNSVPALSTSEDTDPTVEAAPTLESAVIEDGSPGEVQVTFSEEVEAPADINESFESQTFSFDGSSGDDGDTESVTLEIEGDEATPGANFTDDLSYVGDPDVDATAGDNVEAVIDDGTIVNEIEPELINAEVSADSPGEIVATFDTDQITLDDTSLVDDFELGTEGAPTSGAEVTNDATLSGDEVTIQLSEDVLSADGDSMELDYSPSEGTVQSLAGIEAGDDDVAVDNHAEPLFVNAEVPEDQRDQLHIEFTEDVDMNVSDGNIDVAVTDAFTFDDGETEYRIRNFSEAESDLASNEIVLNLGQEDGTPVEVEETADLSGSLSFDPEDPSGDNQYPFDAAEGTEASVTAFTNEDVNNLGVAAETTERGDEIHVTLDGPVDRVGTESQVANAFEIDDDSIELGTESFDRIEGNTVIFSNSGEATYDGDFVAKADEYNSDTDLSEDLSYTGEDGNHPLEIDGEPVEDFENVDILNNNQPFITGTTTGDEIQLTYSEEIDGTTASDSYISDAFELDGTDAEVDESTSTDSGNSDQFNLTLRGEFDPDEDDITLTYTGEDGDNPVVSDQGESDAVALDDAVEVINPVVAAPSLVEAVVDDAPVNNNYDTDSSMVLTFDRAVDYEDSEDASGLVFEDNLVPNEVDIEFTDINTTATDDAHTAGHDDVIVVDFESNSSSTSSNVNFGDNFDEATLTIENADDVDIVGDGDNTGVEDGDTLDEEDEVRNEIAGDLYEVDNTEITVELIGTESNESGDFIVNATGFEDENELSVIDHTVVFEIGDAEKTLEASIDRFADEAELDSVSPGDFDTDNVEINGEAVDVEVAGADVSDTDEVTFVHDQFEVSENGYELTSMPMPGELVEGDNINSLVYNTSAGQYTDASDISDAELVHNGLSIGASEDDSEYGFAYEEGDVSSPGTHVEMDEGWNVVGTNFNLQGDTPSYDEDLSLGDDPSINDDNVRPWNVTDSYQFDEAISPASQDSLNTTDTVDDYEVYYVYMHEEADRAIQFNGWE